MKYRRFFVILALPVLLLSFSFFSPVSAATVSGAVPINYNQFVSKVVVDGANDLVTVSIPSSYFQSSYSTPSWTQLYTWSGPEGSFNVGNQPNGLQVVVSPFGDLTRLASSGAFDGYFLSLKNIPSDATFSFDIQIEMFASSSETPRVTLSRYASNSVTGSVVSYNRLIQLPYVFGPMGDGFQYLAHVEGSFDTNYDGWYPIFNIVAYGVGGVVSTYLTDFDIKLSINSYYRALQESGLTDQIDDLRDQLADQGQKLDDIISGGSAGDDLMSGSDKLEDAGAGLGDSIGDISDFENAYMGQLDDQLPDILASADLNYLVSPLAFVKMYTDKIVAGVPSQYLLIFTLPALFGIFFYIVGHPIRAPKPDTSGDVVTRETFTTTTVLTGKHAGQTSTVRTVTQSQEIGRVSGASDN